MKKNTVRILAAALVVAICATVMASCGIIIPGEYRFGLATVETKDSQVAASVIIDASDRIALVRIDEIANGDNESKKTKGDSYGMLSDYGSKLAEWDDQIAHLEGALIGKTIEEVTEVTGDDADVKAGCTVYIGNYIQAVALAIENAKKAESFSSTVDHIALTLSLVAGEAGAHGDTVVVASAAALNRGYIAASESKFCGAIPGEYRFGLATVNGSDSKVSAAVVIDENNRVISAFIDEFANGYSASKKALGDDYGMLAAWGSQLAEWDDQITHLENTLVGKNAEQILGVSADDADVATGCTVYVGNYVKAVAKAIDNAKTADSFSALAEDVAIAMDFVLTENGEYDISAKATVKGVEVAEKEKETTPPEALRFAIASVNSAKGMVAATVVLNAENKVVFVKIDEMDVSAGKTDSKKTQGDAYGMLAAWGSQLAEWDDQIAHLENYLIGKTLAEVSGVTGSEADVTAGCTVYVGNYIQAVAAAITAAQDAEAFTASRGDVLLILDLTASGSGTYTIAASAKVDVEGTVVASGTKTASVTIS